MDNFVTAALLSRTASREVTSARPHAPVVPYVATTPRTPRVRVALAAALERASRAVAPAECSPVR
jgi:hypothetical protein